MKNFGTFVFTLILVIAMNAGYAQNFMENGLKKNTTYVLLAHPTANNIETIQFLLENNILKLPDVEFIGVYPANESYDYSESVALINDPGMKRFHLQKVEVKKDTAGIYGQNESDQHL